MAAELPTVLLNCQRAAILLGAALRSLTRGELPADAPHLTECVREARENLRAADAAMAYVTNPEKRPTRPGPQPDGTYWLNGPFGGELRLAAVEIRHAPHIHREWAYDMFAGGNQIGTLEFTSDLWSVRLCPTILIQETAMHPLPHPWAALILALAAYRLTRLTGWDDFPPIYKLRARLIRETWVPDSAQTSRDWNPPCWQPDDETAPELPGKTPTSEVPTLRPAYGRPLLAHLIHCPFCLGWWVSVAVYGVWLAAPTVALYVAAPFALSGFVGVVAKNLDA